MITVSSIQELRSAREGLPQPVGFVPTMGYLHAGHISLANFAKKECASVVVSIFVNPTQFGPQEDLTKYPCDLKRDLNMLEEAGVDLVWIPSPGEMYPAGFQTWIMVETLTQPLEGAVRPGHFRGVSTVVVKLFNAVRPQKAYFGQKDAQQVAVIRCITKDLNFPVDIVVCPTVREADGLALSSRNTYLNPEERKAACVLFSALNAARQAFEKNTREAEMLRQIMINTIQAEPLAKVQYVSCADFETLAELETVSGKALLSLAVYVGKTRLIDNLVLE